jgi:hypothetical protein
MISRAPRIVGAAFILACCVSTRIDSYSTIQQGQSKTKTTSGFSPKIPETNDKRMLVKQSGKGKGKLLSNKGWHRRLWSKVAMTKSEEITTTNTLSANTYRLEQDASIPYRYLQAQDDFILQSFETESPDALFPLEPAVAVPIIESCDKENLANADVDSPFTRFTRKTFEKILTERLDKWSKGMNTKMIVECEPTSNMLQVLRGQFHCDATINLDRIVFGNFQVSGGQLRAKNFCLNLLSFAPFALPMVPSPRYPNRFDLIAQNVTLTQDDLWESSSIRNGLRRLMNRILKGKGITAMNVTLSSIQVLPTGKLSCIGEATAMFGPPIIFEVRTSIGISGRGHVLSFPGLEVAISPAFGFFVPVIPELTVDLGHNAQLLDVVVDGDNALIKVSACVTITPEHTLRLKEYIQSSAAFGAHCFVDVGRWLTTVGRFAR